MAVANTGSHVDPQNKIGHPAHRDRQLMQVPVFSAREICMGSKTCVTVFWGLRNEIVDILSLRDRVMCSMEYKVCCVVLIPLLNI